MGEGNNVVIVLKNPYQWEEIPDNFCEVLISGQVFEHVEFPWFTIQEIARVLKPNGITCIIVPSMQRLHRYPVNTQNYFADGLIALSRYAGLEVMHCSTNLAPPGYSGEWYCNDTEDTMLIAKKPANWKKDSFDKINYKCKPADLEKMATGFISLQQQNYDKGKILSRRAGKFLSCFIFSKKKRIHFRKKYVKGFYF
jgi:SAM-dependent methyltransferase